MNFINRALKGVTRNKTKSILLIVTFFLIGNFVLIGLGVSYAAENAKTLTRQKMKPVIRYEIDWDSFYRDVEALPEEEMNEAYLNSPHLKLADFNEIANDSHVVASNVYMTQYCFADGFDYILPEGKTKEDFEHEYDEGYFWKENNIRVMGNMTSNMIEFYDGTYEIVEGNYFTKDDLDQNHMVCCVTDELAKLNNLHIGSHISIDLFGDGNWYYEFINKEETFLDLEVVGIYKNNTEMDANNEWMYEMPEYLPGNCILLPGNLLSDIFQRIYDAEWEYEKENYATEEDDYYSDDRNKPNVENSYSGYVMLLDDPLYVEEFQEKNASKLDKYYLLDANDELFNRFAKPLDTMSLFANIIVWIVVINAVVIITLVTALTMKNREHEIGILLSIGVEKTKVVAQYFLELAIVAIIGFTFAVLSGVLSAKTIGQKVLEYQMSNTDTEEYYYYGNDDYFTDISQEEMLAEYEVKIQPVLIAEIYGLGLGVVLVSTLIPSFMIMRFNPKKILTDMN